MASKVIIYNNIFDYRDVDIYDLDKEISVEDLLREKGIDKQCRTNLVEIYDSDKDEVMFCPIEDDVKNPVNVAIVVNGKQKSSDYVIKENDVVAIQVLPASNAGNTLKTILGVTLIVGGLILGMVTGGAAMAGSASLLAIVMGAVGAAGLTAIGAALLFNPEQTNTEAKDRAKEGEQNPSIAGSQNQPLDGPFPLIIGRTTITPYLVGSVYNDYVIDNNDHETYFGSRQRATELLAIGYAPLYIKDIQFDSLPVIHNKNNVLSGKLYWEYIQPQTDGPKYAANPNNTSQPITFNGKNLPYEVEAMWNTNKVHMELSQFGAHRTLYPYTRKQKSVDAHLLYCYDEEYREVAGEKMITWQGGKFPTGFRTNTIRFSESVPYMISVGIEIPQGLFMQHVTEDGTEVFSKIPMNLLIQWRPHYKFIDENDLNTFGTGEETYNPEVDDVGLNGHYSEKRFYGWRNFTYCASPVLHTLEYHSSQQWGQLTSYWIVYGKNGVPAKQNGFYGYYKNTSETLSGTFVPLSKIRPDSKVKENIRAGLIERFSSKSLTTAEYNDLRLVVKNGVQVGINLYNNLRYSDQEVVSKITKSAYQQTEDSSDISYSEYVIVAYNTYAKAETKEIIEMFLDVRAASLNTVARQDAEWCTNHPNKYVQGGIVIPTSYYEVWKNKGLSEGTRWNCNPDYDGVTAWSFGSASCGKAAWENNATDPSTTTDWQQFTDLNITNGAKNQMRFEISAYLSKEDILDLLNKNPKSKHTEEVFPELAGLTDVSTDSIEVRVIRLTPCYINKTDGSVKYSYSDMIKWSYIKTLCMDKQKLLDDINNKPLSHNMTNPITHEVENRKYSAIDCDPVTYNNLDFHNPVTWLNWNIANYLSKPVSAEDSQKLALLALQCEPDAAGQMSSSIDKINLTAYAITPSYTENWTRYWYVNNGVIKYRDYYDSSVSRDVSLHPVYSPSDKSDDWKTATQEEYDAVAGDITLIEGTSYGYQQMKNLWDGKFFPEKVETSSVLEVQSDDNCDVMYNEHGDPIVNIVKYGNNWTKYISRLMKEHKDSAGRWIATDSFIETFTNQNAVAQALGALIGQSLGKDAYNYNSTNYSRYVRYWHVQEVVGGTTKYWYRDVDDLVLNESREMPFTPTDGIWVQSSRNAWLAAERTPLEGIGEFTSFDSYSMRKIDSSFNMLLLKEAYKYTDTIDIGGPYGPLSYKCNMVLISQQKTQNILSTILGCGRAYWFYDELGRIEIHNDKPRKIPAMLITEENIISSSFSRSFEKGIAGYHIQFQDENNNFLEGELYVLREGQDRLAHTRDITDLQIQGITDPKQMWAMAVYMLGQTITRRETWEIKLNHSGTPLAIGSMVELQSSVLKIGTDMSGRISRLIEDDNYIYGFIADRTYDYRAEYNEDGTNVQGCSLFQGNAKQHSKIVTIRFATREQQENGIHVGENTFANLKGQTNLVLFEKPIVRGTESQYDQEEDEETGTHVYTQFALKEGDVVAFGNVGYTTSKAIVYQLQYDEKEKVTVNLYPYFDELYKSGNKMPVYSTNMTKRGYDDTLPVDMSVNRTELNTSVSDATGMANKQIQGLINGDTAQVLPPDNVSHVSAVAYRDSIQVKWDSLDSLTGNGLRNMIQYYTVKLYRPNRDTVEFTTSSSEFSYLFDRDEGSEGYDGYPEADELETWYFTVTATNGYGQTSEQESLRAYVNADPINYGTWILSTPNIDVKVEGRFVTLTLSQPPRVDGRIQYGNIQYGILIRRPDTDDPDVWWTPATSGDPIHDEDAYRDVTHTYLIRNTPYIQRLPLLSATPPDEGFVVTQYEYRVVAVNEAGYTAANYRDTNEVFANFDNIQDFVKANQEAKQAIVSDLSAISANLGKITGGAFGGGEYNYWTLSTFDDAQPDDPDEGIVLNKDYQGAFQVGGVNPITGEEQFLRVVPQIALDGRTINGYEITFKVGKFEISSQASKLNGEFIVQTNETSLNRTRITPIGTFFESRATPESTDWEIVAKQDTGGILSEQVYSNKTLLLSNAGIEARRNDALDIGTPYLSSASRVYHFDTDSPTSPQHYTNILDQYGNSDLTVTIATGGLAEEVGEEDSERYNKDLRPAIQVKAPYSEVGKSLAGQFSLAHSLGNGTEWTVDFWFQYTWAEAQEMFSIETGSARVSIKTEVSEPNYNYLEEGVPPYNTESMDSGVGVLPYNVARPDGCNLIYERDIRYIFHLDDLGIHIKPDEWVHCAVTLDAGKMKVLLSNDEVVQRYLDDSEHEVPYIEKEFTGAGAGGTFSYNGTQGTALIDELMIDPTTAEEAEDFGDNSVKKIPWGALSYEGKRFMLVKDEDAVFVSNINFADNLILTDADFEEIK